MQQPYSPFETELAMLNMQRRQEKLNLRKDLSYVGALSLALTIVMQFAFTLIVLLLLKMGILSAAGLDDPFLGLSNTNYLFLYMFVYFGALFIPAVLVSLSFGKRHIPFPPAQPLPFGLTLLAIVGAVGLCMISNIANSYILAILSEMGVSIPEAPEMMTKSITSLLLNLFTIAVLPALLEEMIYRGYILRVLRPYGNFFAILVSTALFSLMHGNVRQIPFAFIVGFILGYLYVATNNIWVPVAVHFANNAISVLMEYFAFYLPDTYDGVFYSIIIYGLAAVGSAAFVILLICYHKRLRFTQTTSLLNNSNHISAMFMSPLFLSSVALYLILLILES